MTMFTASDYHTLHSLVFRLDYPGYRPNIVESPNGDGNPDTEKRYAHVASKYLANDSNPARCEVLEKYLQQAHSLAMKMAISIGVPPAFWPSFEHGALRIIEYGRDAITNPHTDFDLFTLMLYRNIPEHFKYIGHGGHRLSDENVSRKACLQQAQTLNAQVHFGELLEEIDTSANKIWKATRHEVVASGGPTQFSVVYFAIPDHSAVIRGDLTVGKWLEERLARSRYEK